MGTYVTANGFQGRNLQQIKTSLQAGFRGIFGADYDLSEDGPDGQVIGQLSSGLADAWEGIQEVYSSFDPAAAIGAALDRICAYSAVSRISAAATSVDAMLYTDATNLGVVIPPGSEARRVRGALVFSLSGAVTIATASCQDLYIGFASAPAPGASLTLTTTFGTFTATVDGGGSMVNALVALANAINANTWATVPVAGAVGVAQVWNAGVLVNPTSDTIGGLQDSTDLLLRIVHPTFAFGVTVGTWKVFKCGSQGTFVCSSTGPNTAGPGELSAIVTPQTGWVGVVNLLQGSTGRATETDEELRIRRTAEQGQGYATERAILKSVNDNVVGVSSVSVISNRGDTTDSSGRPPHSVAVNVIGGDVTQIANAIWLAVGAGIQTTGATSVNITDSQGFPQTVSFTRPSMKVVWVKVTFSLYAEEAFPPAGTADIVAAVVAWCAANLTTGKDVIGGRIAGAVYAAVPGIGPMTVTVSDDGATYVPTYVIDSGHYAFVDADHVSTVLV
jgi:hypothetical protein